MVRASGHAKVIETRKTVNHAGKFFTGFMQHGARNSLAGERLGGHASYVVGVSQNNGNRFLNDLGSHTLPF